MLPHSLPGGVSTAPTGAFALRVAIAGAILAVIALLAAGLFLHAAVPLLLFSAVLAAVFLDAASAPLRHFARLPRAPSVVLVVVLLLTGTIAGVWLSGPRLGEQMGQLQDRLPRALERIESSLAAVGLDGLLPGTGGSAMDESRTMDLASQVVAPVTQLLGTAASGIAVAGVVAVLAFFLAIRPRLYVRALLRLVPPGRRRDATDLLDALANALRWWLAGRLASMSAVGLLTLAGLFALGIPLALLLSVVAALLSFIPYLGPLLAAGPALLVALSVDVTTMVQVAALYTVVQVVENNLVTPLIQQRVVSLPPAALIAAQLVMGAFFGFLGILCATPLTVALVVTVQMLYVERVLGEEIRVMGQSEEEEDEQREAGKRSNRKAGTGLAKR